MSEFDERTETEGTPSNSHLESALSHSAQRLRDRFDAQPALARFETRRIAESFAEDGRPERHQRVMSRVVRRRVWAALTVVLAIGAFAVVGMRGRFFLARNAGQAQIFQTAVGEQSIVRLADGSVMTLAPATKATVSHGVVNVSGEAYFQIQPRANRAFIVHTANAVVRVLGTAFTVRQYVGEPTSLVAVEEGKVAIQPQSLEATTKSPVVLSAQMLGHVTDSSVAVTPGIAMDDYTSWTRGRLVFNETPLGQVIADLSRAYGVEIRLADSTLATMPVTATTRVREDALPKILGLITSAVDAHYTRSGDAFVIARGRILSPTPRRSSIHQSEPQYGR